ncbi:MAG: bifunctional proline dehydrogenase/L-glutamate gamma-semialdehyde dehydrogenase [Desulfurellaceae bacterium]|nr:bifunctional proline dehydrogenase/L-glutamate gamma-semialdehyde dehydrogenase [Desulfurellaceae bacterium]
MAAFQYPGSATTDASLDQLAERAVALAARLLANAKQQQNDQELAHSSKIARMMEDPPGKALTLALADQAFRSRAPARIADQLRHLIEQYGVPHYFAVWEQAGLFLAGLMATYMPQLVVPRVAAKLRNETHGVILPAEEQELRAYLDERYRTGTRLNLNQLGEAILGEREANHRLHTYLSLLERDDVEYISVKISSIVSQINLVAFEQTLDAITHRLRVLYRAAMARSYLTPSGQRVAKFINLDMEEYRDLHLTLEAFRRVLSEEEFLHYRAGIVLQAYLPDSYPLQQELTRWARQRIERGGAPIKLRIVKGANLAMERIEAGQRGWEQAPYPTKLEVDANYKRMLHYGCRPAHARAVRLGIASHNLFDIAYGLLLRDYYGVADEVEFEMLEGMANHQARAVQQHAGGLLLYAPVVKQQDFHSAIAYLVRRLDENTTPHNFLHDVFGLEPDSPAWNRQKAAFMDAVRAQASIPSGPRRTQDRTAAVRPLPLDAAFVNTPDTDWSLPHNQRWVADIVVRWSRRTPEPIPLQISGAFIGEAYPGQGRDPSRPYAVAYHYAQARHDHIDRALDTARRAQADWAARPISERKKLLGQCAEALARDRGELIGAVMLDGGKTAAEADAEVSEAVDFANYYARCLDSLETQLNDCAYAPLGTVLVVPPWNFPLAIPCGGVLAALMAGNTVILKPAPEAVLVGWQLCHRLWEAGIPKTVLQFLPTRDDAVGTALVSDARVQAVILTGAYTTGRLFQAWKPDIRLLAETSGKNSLIVTALADKDQAIKELVHSAFGHAGQKCSAVSLAVLEAEVYDDPSFLRQLRDAAASLQVGPVWDLASRVTPLIREPSPELWRALTRLDDGESWLLEPKPVTPQLWSPGIKLGVQPGSFFHTTECFGPVLGLTRADNLDHAISIVNTSEFGLTSGIHSLDDRETARWQERIEVGNAYINRSTTGAIVRRQPFGGWKKSSFGGGAKAGGPNYVLSLGRWSQARLPRRQLEPPPALAAVLDDLIALGQTHGLLTEPETAVLRASAGSYTYAWRAHFAQAHDPSRVPGERNTFRYRPLTQIVFRIEKNDPWRTIGQVLLAATICQGQVTISVAPQAPSLVPLTALGLEGASVSAPGPVRGRPAARPGPRLPAGPGGGQRRSRPDCRRAGAGQRPPRTAPLCSRADGV